MSRLKNHRGDVGMSDSLVVTPDGFLLAASFLVDSGCPSINSKYRIASFGVNLRWAPGTS